uniref:Aldehyde dehydrogenase domain-containing protein n=1 Tax=Chelonoidis abingdonii TaxID=106734 RepID=A0A8C0FXZ0_CHEAB
KWLKLEGRETTSSTNPVTGELLATTLQGEPEDVEAAVQAATKAFEGWSRLPCHARARHLHNMARTIQKHQRLLALLESLNTGKPVGEARDRDLPLVVRHFYHHAGWAQLMGIEMGGWKPLGVVAAVVTWNSSLLLLAWKICPALAMGNTVVLLPPPRARLSALLLAELGAQAGLPPGVLNVLTGERALAGGLAAHPGVDAVAVAGSVEVRASRGALPLPPMCQRAGLLGGRSWGSPCSGLPGPPPLKGPMLPALFSSPERRSASVTQEAPWHGTHWRTQKTQETRLLGHTHTPDLALCRSLQVGTVWINGQNLFDAAAGVGGTKESGNGRDGGKEGLYEYVRPSWQSRARPGPMELDYKTFAASSGVDPPPVPGGFPMSVRVQSLPRPPLYLCRVDRTYKLYYGGAQKRPEGMASLPVLDPAGNVLAYVADGSAKDIRNAVEAAHKAAPGWGKRAAHARAQVLYYVAENLELRREEVASRLGVLTGAPPEEAQREVDLGLERLFHWAALCDKSGGTVQETPLHGTTLQLRQPLGVVGVACPDERPLLSFLSLLAPAVARGNAVVMVPSPRYPLPALDLCQIFDTSDVPGGVVNIVTGNRDHLSRTLAQHHDVQAMWYFGSPEGSQFVEWASAGNLKRTWVSHGVPRRWEDPAQGAGEEFLYQATQCKNVWIPMGEIFAN